MFLLYKTNYYHSNFYHGSALRSKSCNNYNRNDLYDNYVCLKRCVAQKQPMFLATVTGDILSNINTKIIKLIKQTQIIDIESG